MRSDSRLDLSEMCLIIEGYALAGGVGPGTVNFLIITSSWIYALNIPMVG